MQKEIRRSVISGKCRAPPSGALAHRALIVASLSPAQTVVSGVPNSASIDATIGACGSLGADIVADGGVADIFGIDAPPGPFTVDCGDSNTTLKLMLPICTSFPSEVNFIGSERLGKKLMAPFLKHLDRLHVSVPDDALSIPVTLKGPADEPDIPYFSPMGTQYLSGLLLAAPLRDSQSRITVDGRLFGFEYVGGTIAMMESCGINVFSEGSGFFQIEGGQEYAPPGEIKVPSSPFLCSFPLLAGAICGKAEVGGGLVADEFSSLLQSFGAKVSQPAGSALASAYSLDGAQIDALEIGDYAPHALALAAHSSGKTTISNIHLTGARRANRVRLLIRELSRMGAKFSEGDGTLIVEGGALNGAQIEPDGDAHVAAVCAVAGLLAKGATTISGAECITEKYPSFFDDLVSLGAIVR